MDDQQVARSNTKNSGRTSKREHRARAGEFRRWLCHAPSPDDHQNPSGSQRQNATGLESRRAKKKCSRGCCSGCWCACKTSSSCWCACKTVSRNEAEKDDALERPARRIDAVPAAERLPLRARRRDAAVAAQRLPPGPARELPIPSNVVGQDVYLKTALSHLADDAVDIVGIYGPGGIGKTTLLRSINNQFCSGAGRAEFDHVMLVAVGKDPVLGRLQRSIAYEAGLLLKDGEDEVSRAAVIFNFLKGKSYLLLLDDIWEPLQLSKIGIPQPFSDSSIRRKQKLFLTTRLVDIAGKMQAHKIIILEHLKWEESWNLFKLKVGDEDIVSDQRIRSLAMALVKECSGLPLALVTMGLAMAAKKRPEDWQSMITLIKSLSFHEISGMGDELLPLLHVGYANLQDSRTRDCFLHYSLWPEGYHVLKENAIKSWMGLGSIGQFESVLQAYDAGYCIIESLKAASLFQSSEQNYRRLEMPEVIREMALWIASQQGGKKGKWLVQTSNGQTRPEDWSRAETIALMYDQIKALPDPCYCPHLQTLILRGNKCLLKIPSVLLHCMPALKYLDLSHTGINHLPAEVGILVNLQFLNLSFTKISSLPDEMHGLVELKYLELEGTSALKKIPHGMIACLERLQALNFYRSGYANWNWLSLRRHEGITFEELVSLPQLRYVGITVENIPSLLRLFSMRRISVHSLAIRELRGLISLHLLPALLSRSKMGSLRNLTIESSQGLKELVLGETNGAPTWSLPKLEVFNLVCLPELEKVIWRGVTPDSCLPNLRFLSLFYCNAIKNIAWVVHLPCLQELYVQHCNELVQFIGKDASRESSLRINEHPMTSFPELKYIFLRDLKKLVSISDHVLPFPSLERILVYNCLELKQLPFGLKSAEKMRMIHGERSWWEKLEWEDQSIKSIFLPCFREIPAECEPTMKAMHGL